MDLSSIRTFISIGAHCDDIEARNGGLFARLTRQGARGIYVVVVENPYVGEGVPIHDTATALATRRAESRQGAAVLGAARVEFFNFKSYYLSTPDRQVFYPAFRSREETEAMAAKVHWYGLPPIANAYLFPECVERLTSLVTEEKPDLIITHCPNDRHPDHYQVARFTDLVLKDLRATGIAPQVWLREPNSGGPIGGWRPTILVELAEADVEAKQRALDSFPSQHPNGIAGFARRNAERYGRLAGVPFAEAYTEAGIYGSGDWDTDAGFQEALALASAPLRVIRL